jgi:hypothetical protein
MVAVCRLYADSVRKRARRVQGVQQQPFGGIADELLSGVPCL